MLVTLLAYPVSYTFFFYVVTQRLSERCVAWQRKEGLRSRDLAMIWTSRSAHSKISSIVWKAGQSWKTVFCPNLPVRKEDKIETLHP